MPRSRARTRRGFSPARRQTTWEEGFGQTAMISIDTTSTVIIGSGIVLLQDGLTLVRTRGELVLQLTGTGSITDGFDGAVGVGIVTSEAFAVGQTAMPDPLDDSDWDGWLWHQFYHYKGGLTLSSTLVTSPRIYQIDSKAMRKVDQGDTIFCNIAAVETNVASMQVGVDSRCLFKLP